MAGFNAVFDLIKKGNSARAIMEELKMPPSKLRRILRGPRMRTVLAIQKEVAMASMNICATVAAPHTPQRLSDIAWGEPGEIGRRACVSLINTLTNLDVGEKKKLSRHKGGESRPGASGSRCGSGNSRAGTLSPRPDALDQEPRMRCGMIKGRRKKEGQPGFAKATPGKQATGDCQTVAVTSELRATNCEL